MPVKARKIGNKYRVVESSNNKISRTSGGKARDGGGGSKVDVIKQVNAINLSQLQTKRRKGK